MTKPKAQKLLEETRDDLLAILERLIELASTDPYLTDAVAFLTQGKVCIEKQLLAEFNVKPKPPAVEPPDPPKPEGGSGFGVSGKAAK